ncbi:MAG: chromosomal replication initiator protein DnaA, partial [Firmicutes bacterium]|nr:chromosomal replication initiator protein DnaA [Bacillota bacterium]
MATKELWQKMLTRLETEISAVNFDVWIKTLEPVQSAEGKLVLCAANAGIRNFVTDKFKGLMIKAMVHVNPAMKEIAIIDPSNRDSYTETDEEPAAPEPEPAPPVANVINPRYNFENFVVGKSNQFMYAAAIAVSNEPGIRYNPLFIYGGAGLGKTHIMHAIGNSLRMSHPHLKVLYAASEKFLNEFIEYIRTSKAKSTHFREKYRAVDVLMIDDIQFIAGKPETQVEMFNTFNELHGANKQLVFTSDRPPDEIQDLEERLRSRFKWGLMADVQQPDLETRIAILQKKAETEKYNIPANVLAFMAESMSSNVRDMESLLNKVILLSRLSDRDPDIETVKEALKDYADKTEE